MRCGWKAISVGLFLSLLSMPVAAQSILTSGGEPNPAWNSNALRLWLRADAGVTNDPNDATQVSSWEDQSTYGNDAGLTIHDPSRTDGGPEFIANGFGNQPTLRFVQTHVAPDTGTGRQEWIGLPDPSDQSLSFTNSDLTQGNPIDEPFIVFYVTDMNSKGAKLMGKGENSDREWEIGFTNSGKFSMGLYGVADTDRIRKIAIDPLDDPDLDDPLPHIFVGQYDGSEDVNGISLFTDGTEDPVNSNLGSPYTGMVNRAPWGLAINGFWANRSAGPYAFDGDISEVLIYGADLDPDEHNAVGFYLQQKYGIAGTYVQPAGPCDFDGGGCGLSDINLMMRQGDLAVGVGVSPGNKFDLDGDTDIDEDDITEWLSLAGTENGYSSSMQRGDTDSVGATSPTSRTVDITDFQNFLDGFTGVGSTWDVGNFNGDSVVDITDFSNHFLPNFSATGGGTYGAGEAIPEPSAMLLLGLGALLLGYHYCRR